MANNGFAVINEFSGGLPPVGCDRPNCTGSIYANVLAHKHYLGLRPKCLVCAKMGQNRFYKMPPGIDRSFKNGKPILKQPPNGGGGGVGGKAKSDKERIAELERKLEASITSKAPANSKLTSLQTSEGRFDPDDSKRIKELDKKLAKLNALDEEDYGTYFPNGKDDFNSRVLGLQQKKQAIFARRKATLPAKIK